MLPQASEVQSQPCLAVPFMELPGAYLLRGFLLDLQPPLPQRPAHLPVLAHAQPLASPQSSINAVRISVSSHVSPASSCRDEPKSVDAQSIGSDHRVVMAGGRGGLGAGEQRAALGIKELLQVSTIKLQLKIRKRRSLCLSPLCTLQDLGQRPTVRVQ